MENTTGSRSPSLAWKLALLLPLAAAVVLLKTRAFENLVGIAMVNYPDPLNNGNSQAYTCVAWRNGRSVDTLVAKAGQQEEILLATFDMDDIREFRSTESWRMDCRRVRPTKFLRHGR